jgi:hypothetical protein
MQEPTPADGWPDGPLTETEARSLVTDDPAVPVAGDPRTVHVMDHDPATREAILGDDPPEHFVVELVVETPTAYRMYSYTHGPDGTQWMDYGTVRKADEEAAAGMRATLESYRVLAEATG